MIESFVITISNALDYFDYNLCDQLNPASLLQGILIITFCKYKTRRERKYDSIRQVGVKIDH